MASRLLGVILLLIWSTQTTQSLSTSGQSRPELNDYLFGGSFVFHDLSRPFNNDTVYWPGGRRFQFTAKNAGMRDGIWYAANEFCAAEHGGTHMDAPYHFAPDKRTLGKIPLDNLITPLIVVDMSKIVNSDNDFVLKRDHLDHLFVGDDKRNFTLFFKFGWGKHYSDLSKYFGTQHPTSSNLNFPGIGDEVAQWLVDNNKNLVGIGVDTASVDPGAKPGKSHKIFASHNIFMLENVNMEVQLPTRGCTVILMPMKIEDGTGGPCRITAICPKVDYTDVFQ